VDAGPDHIVITSAPQSGVGVNVCAAPVTFELHHPDGGLAPVSVTTNIALTANPNTGLLFYQGNTCTTVIGSVPVTAGNSSGTFDWHASAGNWTIMLNSFGYVGDSQMEQVGYATPDALAFVGLGGNLPYTLRAGECSQALQVMLTSAATEVNANVAYNISFTELPAGTGQPAGSLKLYSDASCTTQITGSIGIPVNQSRTAAFYLKALTGQQYTINATSAPGALMGSTLHNVSPAVRWSSCGFDAGQQLTECMLPSNLTSLSNAFTISTSASAENGGSGSPMCSFEAVDHVECGRGVAGGPVQISVQTAELPKATVARGKTSCSGDGGVSIAASGFTLAESVALISVTDGTPSLGAESFHTASLSSTGLYLGLGDCSQNPVAAWQVLDIPGLTVDRGFLQIDAGVNLASAPAPIGTPINLASFRVIGGSVDVCSTGMRALNFAANTNFERGLGAAGCKSTTLAVDYQRFVNQSATIIAHQQQGNFSLAAGVASGSISLPGSFDATRTLIFIGSQLMGGTGTGEVSANGGSYGDQLLMVTPVISGTTLSSINVTRGTSVAAGTWTFTAIELVP
jgi:hypothetical protein